MKIVVLYDSVFGNTKKVAEVIAKTLKDNDVALMNVNQVDSTVIKVADVLLVGSPTRAFNPTPAMNTALKALPKLEGKKTFVFDTRSDKEDIDSKAFNFFEKWFGYAADKMARRLKRKGASLAAPTVGFFVADTEGPMKEGELERAKAWATTLS